MNLGNIKVAGLQGKPCNNLSFASDREVIKRSTKIGSCKIINGESYLVTKCHKKRINS